ncbi:MAG: glycosyltransferase family 2 protein [Schleiferiaceae bacterium]|nr:glycosyltransferase family 2 protein [Schleiferiaceae bacterium]
MKTAVVILNWNGRHWLEKFLPIVIERSPNSLVVVADNGSTDDSKEWTATHCPQAYWLSIDQNLGYAGGYNHALLALKEGFATLRYAVLMNSDIEPLDGWLAPLEDFMESQPKAGAIQPKLLSYADPGRFEYAGAMGGGMDHWGYPFARGRVFDHCEVDEGQYDDPAFPEVFWASGACLMVRLEAFYAAGQLDPLLFAHMEEIDLCWRMWRTGFTVHAAAPSRVLHVGGGTLGALSPQKTYLNFRNSLLVVVKNLPTLTAMRIVAARLFLDGLAGLVFLFRGQGKHCLAIIRAHGSFYRLFAHFALQRGPGAKAWPNAGHVNRSIVWAYHVQKKHQIPFS